MEFNGPPNIFFDDWNHQYQLEIIVVYHNVRNQRNLKIQSRENGRKPQIWAILGPFCLILGHENVFSKIRRTDERTEKRGQIYRTNLPKVGGYKSRENEYGDKNNLEIWAILGPFCLILGHYFFFRKSGGRTTDKRGKMCKMCKIKKSSWVKVEQINLETKIIWRQVLNGPNLDQIIFWVQ